MDPRPEPSTADPIALTGLATLAYDSGPRPALKAELRPWLKQRKSLKFMGLQDRMAVLAAGRALEQAGLAAPLGEAVGLFMAVGFIPFEEQDIETLCAASIDAAGRFSMAAFAGEGLRSVSPLLTFRVLPNMPAFHVSLNFGLTGPYRVAYPGPGQLFQMLEEARFALESGEVERALVMGTADQRNLLVEHHHRRCDPQLRTPLLSDAAACLVLERRSRARGRGAPILAVLDELELSYQAFDPFAEAGELVAPDPGGAAGPGLTLARALESGGGAELVSRSADGIGARALWLAGEGA